MDSRFRFLHPCITELWGHGKGRKAGNGKTGASGIVGRPANPPLIDEAVTRSEKK